MSDAKMLDAIAWNRARHSKHDTIKIQRAVGADEDGSWGEQTVTYVMQWQHDNGLKPDGKVGRKTLAMMESDSSMVITIEFRDLTEEEIDGIIEKTVEIESAGRSNPYAAMNKDAEYEGWFDKPKRDEAGRRLKPSERAKRADHSPHKASKYGPNGGIHIGLSWGIIQFTQDGGSLGTVLEEAKGLDSAVFYSVFDGRGDELLEVLTRTGKSGLSSKKLRGPRVEPVDGVDIWREPWASRFEEAAKEFSFKKAQRSVARAGYFNPALEIVKDYNLSSQGDLAVAFDMCVQYGAGGARRYFKRAGVEPTIHDVINGIRDKRGRERREEILAASDVWVHYNELLVE